jgi:hypothetical protein
VEYRNSMVEGCLANVREWLMCHTWIRWYIRDGHGNLRPIWDGTKATEAHLSEPRWRGYGMMRRTERLFDDRDIEDPGALDAELLKYESFPDERKKVQNVILRHKNVACVETRSRGPVRRRHREYDTRQREKMVIPTMYDAGRAECDRDIGDQIRELEKSSGHDSDQRREPTDRFDDYGRYLSQTILRNSYRRFQRTFPENPYRVVVTEYSCEADREFPDQPLLQFWTWSASLHVLPAAKRDEKLGAGLQRYDIADDKGDWCGSIVLDKAWADTNVLKKMKQEFIAISEAKNFTCEECEVWTYYIPKERDQSEWDLYYVLLVEERDSIVKQRVALGKVFRAAFENTQTWEEVVLG